MSKSPAIAAVILTKNEEKNVYRCLQSLSWADEIVVLDSGSTDNTLEIAKKFGAHVEVRICEPFKVAQQRNWAIDNLKLKSEWILFIDADEVVPEKLKSEILNAVKQAPKDVVGFRLCPKFMFMGRWLKRTNLFPAWHDRLCRLEGVKFKGLQNEGAWERFFIRKGHRVENIYEPYLHYGFNNGFHDWFLRHNRYSSEMAFEIFNFSQNNYSEFLNRKKKYQYLIFIRFPLIAPLFRFLYLIFWRGGILEGLPGLIYASLMMIFDWMVCLKIIELKRRSKCLPL